MAWSKHCISSTRACLIPHIMIKMALRNLETVHCESKLTFTVQESTDKVHSFAKTVELISVKRIPRLPCLKSYLFMEILDLPSRFYRLFLVSMHGRIYIRY